MKPNTVHDILAEKEIWLALDKNSPLANSKRRRTVGFPTIESALALWIEHAIHHEQVLTGEILKVKITSKLLLGGLQISKTSQFKPIICSS